MKWNPSIVDQFEARLEVDKSRRWKRRRFADSPKGLTPEGLQDFRGFPLRALATFDVELVDFAGVRSPKSPHGVDVPIQISSCRCRRVSFAGGRTFHLLHGIFEDCCFDRIAAAGCGFTGIYRQCSFRGAKLRDAHLVGEFYDCDFEGADLRVASWASFQSCGFKDCQIDPLFEEIRLFTQSAARVSFAVDNKGRPKPGVIVKGSNVDHTEGLPWADA